MTMETDSNQYQRALELAGVGRYEEALACIEEHLRGVPEDGQALNDAGAILHCLGRSDEAIHHLVKAREHRGDCAEILWNLVEAYLANGRAKQAVPLFDHMERLDILNADIFNRTANVFLDQGNRADAIEVLLRSLQLWPEQEILKPMIEVIRSQRPKIAFFCRRSEEAKFLVDIYEFAERRFPVRLFEDQDVDEMHQLMQWSDISWFEWCTDMAVEASKQPKVCKTIIRLHDHEAYDTWPSEVQWDHVDMLITVGNQFVRDALLKQVPDMKNRTRTVMVPNGVNLDKFKFLDKSPGKNLACVGNLGVKKNPMFLLQCMQKLHYLDPEYKLFVAGTFNEPMLEQYVRHMVQILELNDAVLFDGWQQDMNSWLQDKHYIVSCSIGESQGMGLLEGMACGLKPVIHNFPGAKEIFPPKFVFNIAEQFCEQILSDQYEPRRYRGFVEANYALKEQLSKIHGLFTELEAEINLHKTGVALRDRSSSERLAGITLPPQWGDLTFGGNARSNSGMV